MRVLRLAVLGAFLAALAFAEVRMSVRQLRSFIESSQKLGQTDRQVAEYLKNVKLTERLEPGVMEDLQSLAGARTREALQRLAETSKGLPVPPPPPAPPPPAPVIPAPSSEEQGRILDQARDYALEYSRRLPNFICTQVTRRYEDPSGLEFWAQRDVVTTKLSYFEQKEDYKVVLVNNHYVDTTLEKIGGTTVRGEFGSMLRELFEYSTAAKFDWERWATLRGKRMYVFSFRVPVERSKWSINYSGNQIMIGYSGLVYVDTQTLAVMRLLFEAQDIPITYPVQQASTTLDYDYVAIAGNQHVLPLKSTTRMRAGKVLVKNDTEYRLYNRFGAEATITYTPEPLPEDQLKEQQPEQAPKPKK